MNRSQIQPSLQPFRDLLETGVSTLPGRGIDWLDAQRAHAMKDFMQQSLPTRQDEAWRYTSLERLLDEPWSLPSSGTVAKDFDIDSHTFTDSASTRLVFVDGRWSPALSRLHTAATGVRIGSLRDRLDEDSDALAEWLGRVATQPTADKTATTNPTALPIFAALNTALLDDGAWVQIPAGVQHDGPIEIIYLCTAQDAAPLVHPRNLIVVEDGAAATLVERYVGVAEAAYFTNALTEIHLGRDARLEHVRLQEESPGARHLSNVYLQQGQNSRYDGFLLSLGGLWSRTEFHNPMSCEHAHCNVNGLYIAGDKQLADVHLDIDHAVPHCVSRERFKGILLGRGRAVFDGRIRVRVDAQKTDAQLSNDNLLLSRDAEVDTKPQLEIYADDVKCSHGTTVGQLEPAQLFYLRARGIAADVAQRLLCMGFATEILEDCTIPGLSERIERILELRMRVSTANSLH